MSVRLFGSGKNDELTPDFPLRISRWFESRRRSASVRLGGERAGGAATLEQADDKGGADLAPRKLGKGG